ncbi:MAG TPA: cytochrome P450 [Bryobacteraceae bacterium]|nr:cytochrome P450 [Bryobacteraceae bacterium]
MLDFFSNDTRRNPFPAYDEIRSRSPVVHDPRSGTWMVFDYAGVKRVLTDHEVFSSSVTPAPLISKWLIFSDTPRHTKLRRLVSKAFTPGLIAGLEPRIRELSRELLDPVLERGEMDLAADFSIPLPMMVIAEMLGIASRDWPRFHVWGDLILKLSYTIGGSADAVQAVSEGFRTVTAEMSAYLKDVLSERSATPGSDLLTMLAQAELDGERLTDEEMLGFFQLLLVAGTETTTNLLNNAILCLIENPDEMDKLRSSPALLVSAIEEVLRYRSPVQWMFRVTQREVELHGHVIPAGKLVLPMIGSANRDPRQFPEAGRFNVAREPNPHLAFGHGIHFCLGAPLSRLEARIGLAELLDRIGTVRLKGSEPWQPRPALHIHGPASLPICFEPRKSAIAAA